jgi:PPM family protein phosphatase
VIISESFELKKMACQLSFNISVHALSDVGLVRKNNEDFWKQLPEEQFFILADGMGGHQAGEVAARETVELLGKLFRERYPFCRNLEEIKKMLSEIIKEVNRSIYQLGHQHSAYKGMGSTLCCCLLRAEGLIYAHVGDSRIYLFRDGNLQKLTSDHSLLQELIDLGQISEQQGEEFLYKNIITQAMGTESVKPPIGVIDLLPGDSILMCTDGLSDLVNKKELQEILNTYKESEAAEVLLKKALGKGGLDNITLVLISIKNKLLNDT